MKAIGLLAGVFLLAYAAPRALRAQIPMGGITGGGCGTYALTCQNFETPSTGYDNGETWTVITTSGCMPTVNPTDSTSPAPLYGTQSLDVVSTCTPGTNDNSGIYHTFTGTAHAYGFLGWHPVTTVQTSGANTIFNVTDGTNCLLCVYVNNTATTHYVCFYDAADGGSVCDSSSVANGTTYYIWWEYHAGSGSNGVYNLSISTSTTKPGTAQISKTNGKATANASLIGLESSNGREWVEDRALACAVASCPAGIGSNP